MKDDQYRFLTVHGETPARLTAEQVAWILNCQPHDVPVLVAGKLIKSLGNPPVNGVKFYSTAELLEAMQDRNWLVRVTSAIYQHWRHRNAYQRRATNTTAASAQAQ